MLVGVTIVFDTDLLNCSFQLIFRAVDISGVSEETTRRALPTRLAGALAAHVSLPPPKRFCGAVVFASANNSVTFRWSGCAEALIGPYALGKSLISPKSIRTYQTL